MTWAIVLLLVLGAGVLPLRWALMVVLIAGNFDLSGANFASGTEFGAANAVRSLLPPLLLVWRLDPRAVLQGLFDPPALQAFLGLIAFTAVSVLWSPLPLPGIKLVGFLIGWLVLFAVLRRAWLVGLLDGRLVAWLLVFALITAAAQSFIFGNPYGTDENRFTSWTSPQSFAQFLVGAGLLLACLPAPAALKATALMLTLVALPFTGSRSALMGAGMGIAVLIGLRFAQRGLDARDRTLITAGLIALVCGASFLFTRSDSPAVARLVESFGGGSGMDGVRTVRWRYDIWQAVNERIEASEPTQFMFGRGAASGGEIKLQLGISSGDDVDANRAIHCEYLRVPYEFGVLGSLLAAVMLFGICRLAWQLAATGDPRGQGLLATLPMLLLVLGMENIIASSGMAAAMGVLLPITHAVASLARRPLASGGN